MNSTRCIALCLGLLPALSCLAGPAAEVLPVARMIAGHSATAPVPNAAFAPAKDAQSAPAFEGTLRIAPAELLVAPALDKRVVEILHHNKNNCRADAYPYILCAKRVPVLCEQCLKHKHKPVQIEEADMRWQS